MRPLERFTIYVVVTNTNNSVDGAKTAAQTSRAAKVEKVEGSVTHAAAPVLSVQPTGGTYAPGGTATALTVSASVSGGGTLTYQWFRNTANSADGGTTISGATAASYTPLITANGTVYYYVVVTNTNNSVDGVTWTVAADSAFSTSIESIAYGGGRFVAGGEGGKIAYFNIQE